MNCYFQPMDSREPTVQSAGQSCGTGKDLLSIAYGLKRLPESTVQMRKIRSRGTEDAPRNTWL